MTQYNGLYKFRRILSVVLALAVLLLALPAWSMPVNASEPSEPAEHTHNHDGWTAWTNNTSLPSYWKDGKYYLETDIILKDQWQPEANITLCLNGHKITNNIIYLSSAAIVSVDGGTLNIYDCQDSGAITNSGSNAIHIKNSAAVNIYIYIWWKI